MFSCLVLVATVTAVGLGLHWLRIKALERRSAEWVTAQTQALAAEKVRAEQRLGELVALDRSKSRILAGLINDMRTPLMLVMAPLQSLGAARAALAPEGVDVKGVLEQAGQLRHQLGQLGALLELELGDAQLQLSRTDLVALLRNRIGALRPVAERCGATLDFEPGVAALPFAFDREKVEHVLDGLFRRVFEDAAPGDRVRVSVMRRSSPQGDRAVVEMLDTGRHIAERYRRLLCEDGHWADDPGTVSDGTGLSLALAHRFVHLHGGEIRIDEEVSIGTRLQLSLPLALAAAPDLGGDALPAADLDVAALVGDAYAKPVLPEPEPDEPEKPTTVLVVDDHPGTRGYLSFALRRHHNVLEAANGEEALELVREHVPDLVISDVMMPVMDGQALCRAIKADGALNHIPVFLVTANVVPDVKREGLESGADDYLIKPFDLDEAIMRINNMITLRSQLRRRYSREVVIKPSDITVSSADEAFLERARQLVEDHMEDGSFGVQELASELGLSPRQLQRRLRETVDQSPVEFIRTLRLQRAAQLLERQYGNVSEVAYSVGFTSLSYFAKCFREQFGMSPSEFKSEQTV